MSKNYAAQDRYRKRQIETRGLVRVSIWIPTEARDRVLKMAKKLRRLAGHDED